MNHNKLEGKLDVPQKLRQVGISLVCLVAEIPFSFFVSALVAEIVAHQPCPSSDC
jgi:hypothetical protein